MAVITIPSQPGGWQDMPFAPVVKNAGEWESPYTATTQTQLWAGEKFLCSPTLPPVAKAVADDWMTFLRQAEVSSDTFVLNLTDYLPAAIADRAAVSCRLVRGSAQYHRGRDGMYRISFQVRRSQ